MPKATKPQKTSKASRLIKSNPFTPLRRMFNFKLEHRKLGFQRQQTHEQYGTNNSQPDPIVDTPPSPRAEPSTSTHAYPPAPACMALQNDDPAEDAVVITALSTLPFCCHEDLLTMARPALLGVAHTLNAKLPGALRIPVSPARTDAAIRHAIEFVVGLRTREVPGAPRRGNGYAVEVDADAEMDGTPPTSPLARRGANNKRPLFEMYGTPGTLKLGRLEEEEEDEEDRPAMKRQRTASLKIMLDEVDGMDVDTPTPITTRTRGRKHIPTTTRDSSPTPTPRPRVLREQNTTKVTMVDKAFVGTGRARYRKRENGGARSASLPALLPRVTRVKEKPRVTSASPAAVTTSRRQFLVHPPGESTSMSSLTSSQSSIDGSPASSSDSQMVGVTRRRGSIEAEKMMAVGIVGMHMRSTDMDVV